MKVAARELNLLGLTLAVLLLALTYLALKSKFQEWADFRAQREDLLARQEAAQRLLDSRADVEARLAEFRQGLPVFAAGKKAESELLQGLEKMVGQHNLTLTRREADAERQAGDLYETAVTCYWEGELEALVNFLARRGVGRARAVRAARRRQGRARRPPQGHFHDRLRLPPGARRPGKQARTCRSRAGGNGTTLMERP